MRLQRTRTVLPIGEWKRLNRYEIEVGCRQKVVCPVQQNRHFSFFVVSRSRDPRETAAGSGPARENSPSSFEESNSQSFCESSVETTAAIIFVDNCHDARGFTPELAHLGTLPIILRSILQAQSVDASRIIVASKELAGNVIRRDLSRTGRLPKIVEWFDNGTPGSLLRLIGQMAADSGRILLVSGGAAYHSSLLETVCQWDGQGNAVALMSGSQFVGIAALSRQGALDVAVNCPLYVQTPVDLYAWLNRMRGRKLERGNCESLLKCCMYEIQSSRSFGEGHRWSVGAIF